MREPRFHSSHALSSNNYPQPASRKLSPTGGPQSVAVATQADIVRAILSDKLRDQHGRRSSNAAVSNSYVRLSQVQQQ